MTPAVDLRAINEAVTSLHKGRKWILAVDAAAAATRLTARLREDGAAGVMVVAGVEGTGELPACEVIHLTGSAGGTIMEGIRSFQRSIERPSAELLAAVDSFDPEGRAMVLGSGFSREPRLCGRPIYGARRPEWGALEDKTIIDALWDDAGVAHADADVVPLTDAPEAAARLSGELGTVWAADNTEGWHGGGEYLRWVRDRADEQRALDWFTGRAERVRVMPFLDGIPCSIHGFITRDGVAVFLPFEMFVLREVARPSFVYAQGANYWDPPDDIREQMRGAARRVGALLRRRHGYLGGFGIDGVATRDGFMPTELNPRLSVGHAVQCRAAEVPIGDIERMLLAGEIDVAAASLEQTVVSVVEQTRGGGAMLLAYADRAHDTDTSEVSFVFDGSVAVEAAPGDDADGTMVVGPAAFGWLVIVTPKPERTPVGPSFAPRIPALMDLARSVWGVALPDVTPAPDVHAG